LKLQYPGSAEACAAVTAAAAGVPWAVLSAGVDHTTFDGRIVELWWAAGGQAPLGKVPDAASAACGVPKSRTCR
jgi:tagatose 1,6-diphosphate aldolase